ncbi:hypothetical protein OVA03_12295 [Asticcacaulis sp. SL142]|uniref:hypothetical protein n=1 Tax=Asticcacaulis sp. SL142 TaxID=2995155 RepID=UPI00226CA56D|nr:hypothetical protein [Asticcacaulis sp. SL142]WAC47479.1 hypothetical protein OVA03_12295 [Asticcacaulis sp. SL142]
MSSEDWYRNETWEEDIEAAFFAKLKRSRSQRDQYLVIQAVYLKDKFPDKALELIDIYFETKSTIYHDGRAWDVRRDVYLAVEKYDDAINCMKISLQIERENPKFQGTSATMYPYLIATRAIKHEYESVLAFLDSIELKSPFPDAHFKWNAALGLIHADLKNIPKSKYHAKLALEAAEVKQSPFRYHRSLGVVGHEHSDTIRKLEKILTATRPIDVLNFFKRN